MELFGDVNIVRWLLSILVLAILLGSFAIVAPYIGMRRNNYRRPGKKRKIKLVEAMHLDPKRKVIVFQVGEWEHTLLTGPHEDIHLAAEPLEELLEEVEEELPIGFLKRIGPVTEVRKSKDKRKDTKKDD